jgi:hypothetical protein
MISRMLRNIRRYLKRTRLGAIFAACAFLPSASAGPLGLPVQPGTILRNTVTTVRDTVDKVTDTLTNTVEQTLPEVQIDPAGRPIDPAMFEQDENGARIVRGVIVAVALSDRGRDAAEELDIEVDASEDLDALNLEVTKLELPPGLPATAALEALKTADPEGIYDFQHLYDPSGSAAATVATKPQPETVARDAIEIGMIDAGVEEDHPALRDADITIKTTTQNRGKAKPTAHGTAVASLLVGEDRDFHGALSGAKLYAADAFGGSPTGGSAGDIARAIAWLVDEDVPVINISITGPKNALLEAAVRAAHERGHVIVAPVGNDGPAVPVKYPAAYDGVVAVTAVDDRGRVQIDANRGQAVAFAAPGVNIRAAQLSDEYASLTGTSFASPIVAARFAELIAEPSPQAAIAARDTLVAAARRHGDARSIVYGYGILESAPSGGELTAVQ